MKRVLFCLISIFVLVSCKKYCTKEYLAGEFLEIPIQFNNFSENEVRSVLVFRIGHNTNERIDTISFLNMTLPNSKNSAYLLTDANYSSRRYGVYESYLNECDLVFYWHTGTDTLKNLIVQKSKGETDNECHKSHSNVRIDKVSFEHKNKTFSKKELVQFFK
jgi:hypothetical protein